ncbi:SPOR domain-containing protein [Paenibacillus rhizophilus]|uniref:SPOR domain-containing protein n=1 Tax=Paenibacillus rhizophilus TaxID=1850366 RepID=A0A3N9P883_9BACL|nr:SPOR domain-containing protein [Paenibacillus rhizophilus]RQW12461.1 SPOR domain-containing protein [Paenibacillus rhizophilus]
MSNGRMTFRFDAGKDKPRELQPESGPDKAKLEQQAEVYSLDEVRRTAGGSRSGRTLDPIHPRGRLQDREYRLEELEQAYNNNKKTAGSGVDPDDWDDGNRDGQDSEGAEDRELLRDSFLRSRRIGDFREGQPETDVSYADFDYGSPAFTEDDSPPAKGPLGEWPEDPEDAGGGYYTTRRSSSWWKFPASVAGAIGIGLMLGYAALTFIGGVHNGDSADTASSNSAVGQHTAGNAATAPAVPVQVAAQSYYLLQYGVFSTPEGAAQAKQELVSAGLAAGIDPEDGNRVYAGLSSDREQAKLLGSRLEAQGIDLYVKEVTLPNESRLLYTGDGETVTQYFEASGALLGELSSLSATLLGGDTAADTTKVSDLHLQWTEAVKALEAGLPPKEQAVAKELEKSVSQGVSAMNEYGKSKADGLLWEVQSSMLEMLSGQKRLMAAMEQG